MKEGDVVRIVDLEEWNDDYGNISIGCTGIIVDTYKEGCVYFVQIDGMEDEEIDTFALLKSELEVVEEGGEIDYMANFEFTPEYIMKQTHLTQEEKIIFNAIYWEDPCDIDYLLKTINTLSYEEMLKSLYKLESLGFIIESPRERHVYYTTYKMGTQKQQQKSEKESVIITEPEADLLLLMKTVEEYYKERGVNYKISKNGRKILERVVRFLNNMWKVKDEFDSAEEYKHKAELYTSYIRYVYKNLDDSNLNQLKRMVYTGNKQAWKKSLYSTHKGRFIPYFYDYQWSGTHYYGILKKEIPKEPESSMYWTTVDTFLLSRWRTKTYPICRQVLFALETIIIYSMFNRTPEVNDLIYKHIAYVQEFRQALKKGTEDNLVEFVRGEKKVTKKKKEKGDVCIDCKIKDSCKNHNDNVFVVTCGEKVK